jgi:hypothetical protein
LTRSYESNGPDVKIRGNAHHVAEKYLQLARDAHTGGDPVAAENYLQHAEHYFRLIASAQAAQALAQSGQPRGDGEGDDLEDDDDFGGMSDRFASPSERAPPSYSQPTQNFSPPPTAQSVQPSMPERAPYEGDRQGQSDRNGYQSRQDRQSNRYQDRSPRPERPYGDKPDNQRDNRSRDARPRDFRPYRDPQQPPRESALDPAGGPAPLPSFITAAPRTNGPSEPYDATSAQTIETVSAPEPAANPAEAQQETRYQGRGRRRRLRSPYGFNVAASEESAIPPPIAGDDQPGED